jgi:ribosomal protein S13
MKPADIFYSDCILSNGNIIKYSDPVTINNIVDIGISHQNSLIKRSLFFEHSLYNENLHIGADQEFFLFESWKYKSKFSKIKTNISIFDVHGIGSQNTPEICAEGTIIHQNVFQELSETVMEISSYHRTIYYDIIKNYGNTKLLVFGLRVYRYLASRIKRIKYFFVKNNT